MKNVWKLCTLEQPPEDGIYEVRIQKKDSLISGYETTIMEYSTGKWLLRLPSLINEYKVVSWRYR